MKVTKTLLLALVLSIGIAAPALAQEAGRCANGKSANAAMWYSIAHPGLGEYFLQDWGPWRRMPQRKFWLGFIPGFGWPGYLQVKSAIDARNCRINDEIWMRGSSS